MQSGQQQLSMVLRQRPDGGQALDLLLPAATPASVNSEVHWDEEAWVVYIQLSSKM